MTMRFRYVLRPTANPVIPLGGRFVRPRAIIPVTLVGPTNSWLTEALLDTGADDTVFPERLASLVGVDLTGAPAGVAEVAGRGAVPLRYAQVNLRVADSQEQREWLAWVGFTPVSLRQPSLGFAGFLQFFEALFRGDRQEVELTVNGLYAGT
jgi:hypothetical protein